MPEEKPKRATKAKPPKGEHGKLWQLLKGFHNRTDVRAWLGVEIGYAYEKDAIAALYARFDVTSRTFISADELIDALKNAIDRGANLDGALTLAEDAKQRLGIAAKEVV